MKEWQKYINSLSLKQRKLIFILISKILNKKFEWLDIKPLINMKNHFRCRIWDIRIIYYFDLNNIKILYIWPRWDIYKNIKK
jgi:mRNA-degrading endonuclease RelE of RelBE toxin-antitoxin system